MENASKALLIAGAALLVVLLFTVMFNVFSQMAGSASSIYSDLEESDITEFNQQFLNYEGSDLTIQDVVTIINIAKNENENGSMPVTVAVNITWDSVPTTTNITSNSANWAGASVDDINNLLQEKLNSTTSYTYKCTVSYRTVDVDGEVDVRLIGRVTITEEATT